MVWTPLFLADIICEKPLISVTECPSHERLYCHKYIDIMATSCSLLVALSKVSEYPYQELLYCHKYSDQMPTSGIVPGAISSLF